ncbi:MAG: glycoside hydrolase family 3 C-terminal domain-containing protein [Clostridia bacterium]|nr:glycoside hydrolase family 3 C-terminal domain-containing protein [Clostridia bacterium]
MMKHMDTSLSSRKRAELLLQEMTLDEKMAQLVGVFALKGYEDRMAPFFKNGIGQVSTLEFRACDSMEEIAAWQQQLQTLVLENSRLGIPAVFHMEGLCGPLMQDTTTFPSGVSRGSSFDPELERKIGETVSRQEAAFGITQILAPVLDISRDSRMGRQCEPYGEDPTLAAAMGAAYTHGIQETTTDGRTPDAAAKHFFGFHHSSGGIHGAHVDAGDRLLQEIYGKPFQAAITEAGLKGVMPCYGSLNGLPIHASKHYLTEILRDEMGFEGVTVSDYGGASNAYEYQGIGETMGDAGLRCLKAGLDVELPMPKAYADELKQKFAEGEADISLLDSVVLRVLEAKFRMGLFEHPFSLTGEELEKAVHHDEDERLAEQSAREALVLLKNDDALPLTGKEKTIAVFGPAAINARYYFGGYTHLSMVEAQRAAKNSMAGVKGNGEVDQVSYVPGTGVEDDENERFHEVLRKLKPNCLNLVEALKEAMPDSRILWAQGYHKAGADESLFTEALEMAKEADVILLTLGGKNGSGSIATMGEGVDGTDINLPACQDAFIREAKKLGKPLIGLHFDGRPISSDTADEYLDAILECWNPAVYAAEAVVDALLGKLNPSGKMPLSTARRAGQIPVYYNHPNGSMWTQGPSIGFNDYVDCSHRPRYCFGHGLSYTSFEYSALTLDKKETKPFAPIEISLTVKNTGKCEGTEVVQLYVKDVHASMTRPTKELQGFARVTLQPGEENKISFTLSPSQMAFLDEDMRWKIEKGAFEVQIGSSSEDIRLKDSFTVTENAWVEGKSRVFYALGKIQ